MKRFIDKNSFEERSIVATKMLDLYPDRVPVICEPSAKSNIEITGSPKIKYIVPRDITIGKFLLTIRQQMNLQSEQAIYIFVNDILPPISSFVGQIYEKYKEKDKFLYMVFTGENVFGSIGKNDYHFKRKR